MSETTNTTETIVESHPTIKPTVIQMVVLTAIGGVIAAFLASNPEVIGDPEITRVGILVVVFLVAIGLLRLLVRAIVYTKTTYEVTEDRVRKSYELLYRRREKSVPYDLVRSHEFTQDRLETLMGHGTVKLNQGLGTLSLRHIEHPYEFNDAVEEQLP